MAIVCEKCGKEFILLEEVDSQKAFCPYCGAHVQADDQGEICLVTDEPVQEISVGAVAKKTEMVPRKPLLDENFWRVVLIIVVSIGVLSAAAALTWGIIALFGWLFSLGWGFWQWVVGIVGGLAIVFGSILIIAYLTNSNVYSERDFLAIWLIFLGAFLTANYLLGAAIGEGYQVVFACFAVIALLAAIVLGIASLVSVRECLIGYIFGVSLAVFFMILSWSGVTRWGFWPWLIFLVLCLGIIVAQLCIFDALDSFAIVEKILQLIAVASPLILAIIFGVILFSNLKQIPLVADWDGWWMLWANFAIGALISSIVLLKRCFTWWDEEDSGARVAATIMAVISIIASWIGFGAANKLMPNFNPLTFVQIEVTGKESYVENGTYCTNIVMNITNNGNLTVTYVYGTMELYDGETKIGTWNAWLDYDFACGQTVERKIRFDDGDTIALYNTTYADLCVTYQITKVSVVGYDDGISTFEDKNSQTMVLKQPNSVPSGEDGAWNDGLENDEQTSLLQLVQEFAGENAILPDNYEHAYYDENSAGCIVYSYYGDTTTEYSSYAVMFIVADEHFETFYDDCVAKLIANGYMLRDDEYGDYEYVKGDTVIHFGNVRESEVWNGEEYIKEYNYFNYYAYSLA